MAKSREVLVLYRRRAEATKVSGAAGTTLIGVLSIQRLEGSRWRGAAMGFQSGSEVRWFGSSGSEISRGQRSGSVQWTWGGKSGPIGTDPVMLHRRSRTRQDTREAIAPLAWW